MNFLELCRTVARESRTIDGLDRPQSVVNAVGREALIVGWTAQAHRLVCQAHESWLFQQAEFESPLIVGVQRMTAASLSLTRFSAFAPQPEHDLGIFTIYDPDVGRADEGVIRFVPWLRFFTTCLRGVQDTTRPSYYSISPAGEFVLSSLPDKAYRLRGLYRKTPLDLVDNGDTPEIPAAHHMTVVYRALMLVSGSDEAAFPQKDAYINYATCMSALERDQLPAITWNMGALA